MVSLDIITEPHRGCSTDLTALVKVAHDIPKGRSITSDVRCAKTCTPKPSMRNLLAATRMLSRMTLLNSAKYRTLIVLSVIRGKRNADAGKSVV